MVRVTVSAISVQEPNCNGARHSVAPLYDFIQPLEDYEPDLSERVRSTQLCGDEQAGPDECGRLFYGFLLDGFRERMRASTTTHIANASDDDIWVRDFRCLASIANRWKSAGVVRRRARVPAQCIVSIQNKAAIGITREQ